MRRAGDCGVTSQTAGSAQPTVGDEETHMTDQPTGGANEHPEDAAPTPPPPPVESSAPAPPTARGTSYDAAAAKASLQEAHKFDLGIIAAGVIAWLAGFMPFYTASAGFGGASVSANA